MSFGHPLNLGICKHYITGICSQSAFEVPLSKPLRYDLDSEGGFLKVVCSVNIALTVAIGGVGDVSRCTRVSMLIDPSCMRLLCLRRSVRHAAQQISFRTTLLVHIASYSTADALLNIICIHRWHHLGEQKCILEDGTAHS